MKKTFILLILIAFILNSCQFFDKKVPSNTELLNKELKAINWKKVDEFPSVGDCEKIKDSNLKKQCFFEFLTQTIRYKLKSDSTAVNYPELDSINIKVTIFSDGILKLEPQFLQNTSTYNKIKIDSIFANILVDFPKIKPATKRGIPVKTQFMVSVNISKN